MFELKGVLLCAGAAAIFAGIAAWAAGSPASAEQIPQFSADGLGWIGVGGFLDPPPGTGHGPIKQDPAHPFHGNLDGPGQVTHALGNTKDPVLKPWAAAQMQASNEEVLSGERGLPFTAQARCYPGGVPGQLLYPIEPFYFIQTPKEVWMIWQRDHMVRRIYLTDKHSEQREAVMVRRIHRPLRERRHAGGRHHRAFHQEQLHRQFPHAAHRQGARGRALHDRAPTARCWRLR